LKVFNRSLKDLSEDRSKWHRILVFYVEPCRLGCCLAFMYSTIKILKYFTRVGSRLWIVMELYLEKLRVEVFALLHMEHPVKALRNESSEPVFKFGLIANSYT